MQEGEALWVLCWLGSLPCNILSSPDSILSTQVRLRVSICRCTYCKHSCSFLHPQILHIVQYSMVYNPLSHLPNISHRPQPEAAGAYPICSRKGLELMVVPRQSPH